MTTCEIVPTPPTHHAHHVPASVLPPAGAVVHHHHVATPPAPLVGCADQQKLQAPQLVHAPGPGQHVDVDVVADQPLIFDFNPLDAQATRHGNDLTLTFADGGEVVLHQIIEPNGPAPTPLELPDGTVLSVTDLFTAFNLGNILPAAGPTVSGGGTDVGSGHVFAPFDPGDLGPGLTPLGPLGFGGLPRSAEFTSGAGGQFGVPQVTTPTASVTPPPASLVVPPDINIVYEDGTTSPGYNTAGPDVVSNNLLIGAVDSNPSATITVIDITGPGGTTAVSGSTTITGEYGTLTVNPNGTYTYTLDNNNATVELLETHQTLQETFTYVATDGSLTGSSTLVVTIDGFGTPGPKDDSNSIPNTSVPDYVTGDVLTDNPITNGEPGTHTFTNFEVTNFSQAPAQGSSTPVAAGGTLTDIYGDTLTINSNGTYTFTLNESNTTIKTLLLGTSIVDTFTYTASDALADNPTTGNADNTATAQLFITIDGEYCTLAVQPSTQIVYEDGQSTPGYNSAGPDVVSGNLLTGALDTNPAATITVIDITGAGGTSAVSGATTIDGQYGILTVNPNGTYTYTLDNTNATVEQLETHQTLQETFTYVASDSSITASSTLVVTIDGFGTPGPQNDSNTIANNAPSDSVGGNVLTDNPITNGEPGTHTFTNFEVTQFAQGANTAAAGGTLTDSYGDTLTVNSNGTYTFTLNESNTTIAGLTAGHSIVETFAYTASDALADNPTTGNADNTANANLLITITGTTQDSPSLAVDPQVNLVFEDGQSTPGYNSAGPDVVSGDLLTGALDTNPSATITVIDITGAGGTSAVSGATTINGQYGTLTVNPNGTYTYTLNNNNATVELLETHQTLQETFSYVASDGSLNDSSTLVVTIDGFGTPGPQNDSNTINNTSVPDYVAGNVLTDNPITNGEPGSHTFTNFEVTQFAQGANAAAAGGILTDSYGDTLTVNSNGSYTFTLNENNTTIAGLLVGQSIVETFTYTASDALADNPTTGNADNTANANLVITIDGQVCVVDAEPDAATLTVGSQNTATGNVLANDTATVPADLVVASFAFDGTSVSAGNILTDNLGDTLTINANGTYTFTLNQSNPTISGLTAGQSIVEVFTYTDNDNGGTATTSITFTISGATSEGTDVVTSASVHTNAIVDASGTGGTSGSGSDGVSTSTGTQHGGTHHAHGASSFHFASLDTIDLSHVSALGNCGGSVQGAGSLRTEDVLSGLHGGSHSLADLLGGGGAAPAIHAATYTPFDAGHAGGAVFHFFMENAAPLHHAHAHAH